MFQVRPFTVFVGFNKFVNHKVVPASRYGSFHLITSPRAPYLPVRPVCSSKFSFHQKIAESSATSASHRLYCIANHSTSAINSPNIPTEKALANGTVCPPTTPGVLRLYNMRFCPFAQRTRLVLEYKNIPYEMVNVNLKYKPDWFFERNPLGLVPIIEKDGHIIYESTATCEWLDDMYPENRLQPSDPNQKASDRMLLEYFGQLATNIVHKILRRPELRESLIQKTKENFQHFEKELNQRGGPFFGGSQLTMIDFYLWPHMERMPALATLIPDFEISSSNYPRLANWFKCMYDRPEVKVTMMDIPSHLHFLMSLATGKPDYDHGLAV